MADSQPIPIRLPTETVARLDIAAKRLGYTRSGVIRFCVETWLRHFELKGRAALPVDWDEVMAKQDGRKGQRRPVPPADPRPAP
jgi:predicted transcriptional regulator